MTRRAFTLIELMIVLVIVVMLMAILAPMVFTYQRRSQVNATKIQIDDFEKALGMLKSERGSFPTTEQGLKALLYIPLDEQMGGTTQPGLATAGGMNMGANVVGGNDPSMMMGGMPTGGMPNDPSMMMGGGMPGATPMGGMPTGGMGTTPMGAVPLGGAPNDPSMMGGGGMPGATTGMGMGTVGGDTSISGMMGGGMSGMGGTYQPGVVPQGVQPFANPQYYTNLVKRPDPLVKAVNDDITLDPFKKPFRYVYFVVSGVNPITGEDKPAIWSAGPDGQDGTADDICNWDAVAVQRQAVQRQNAAQMQGQGMGGMGTTPDGMGMGGVMPTGMPNMPGMPTGIDGTGGMGMPGMPTQPTGMPGMPTSPTGMPGMPTQPTGMPGMPTSPTGMPGMPTQPTGMPGMPTQPTGMPGMPTQPTGMPPAMPTP